MNALFDLADNLGKTLIVLDEAEEYLADRSAKGGHEWKMQR